MKYEIGDKLERRRLVQNPSEKGSVVVGWVPCTFAGYNGEFSMIKHPNGVLELVSDKTDLRKAEIALS